MKLIKIGKSNNNDIVIEGDNTVSREHLQIFIDDEANVFVTDLNSMNGTFVNGEIIKEPVLLKAYDILKIGNTLINWKAYLADNVSAKDAYKTIVDEDDEQIDYNNYDPFSDNDIQPRKKKKTVYLWFAIMALILVGVGLYFYWQSDKNSVKGTWVSEDNKALVYTFKSDKTFERDSAGVIHTGKYVINDDNKIKLTFDNSIDSFTDSLSLIGDENFSWGTEKLSDNEYTGSVFNFLNKSQFSIKIKDLIPANYDFANDLKVYLFNNSYRNIAKYCPDCADNSNWYYVDENKMKLVIDKKNNITSNIIVNPGNTVSLFILSDNFAPITYVIDTSYNTTKFILSDFNYTRTFKGNEDIPKGIYLYEEIRPQFWNGDIIYSVLKNEFEYKCKVDGDMMKLNGIKFKRD